MLVQLTISNFAIISHLEIDFHAGLNILSGETGAGKSIIINAVNLILGGRASSDLIRTGTNEAKVEALFTLPDNQTLTKIITTLGFPYHGELLIKRRISREGKNRITINGSIATLQMLSQIGFMMISISGQHENQLLLKPENHLYLLDDFGGLSDDRILLSERYKEYDRIKEKQQALKRKIKEGKEKQELGTFQLQEIETANILEEEDTQLEEKRTRLKNAGQLKDLITTSYQTLYEHEDSALSKVSGCIKRIEKGAGMDKRLEAIHHSLESVVAEIEEASLELRGLQKNMDNDPARLEEIEDRIQLLNSLKRKYGPTLKDILSFKNKILGAMNHQDQYEREWLALDEEKRSKEQKIISKAELLSKKRRSSAQEMINAIEQEINLLDMGGTRFEVNFVLEEKCSDKINSIRADGCDRVEFMLSPNIGEELKPLTKIVSGGELSRIMLALKTILARNASVETIIFDEVDAGISGATAEVVGEKLRFLAEFHQILCITHLPQIASKGEVHFLVKKKINEDRTKTIILKLSPDGRVHEIARLLGGKVISDNAIAHAKEMLSF